MKIRTHDVRVPNATPLRSKLRDTYLPIILIINVYLSISSLLAATGTAVAVATSIDFGFIFAQLHQLLRIADENDNI